MASIGPQLRAARERSGISVIDAARRLHIRAMFVDALEREEWSSVGEPVYVRGFIKNYARLVDVDAQSLVDEFNAEVISERTGPAGEATAIAIDTRRPLRYPMLMAAMSIVALVLVARLVWTIASPGAAGHDEVHPAQAAASSAQGAAASGPQLVASGTLPASGSASRSSGQVVDLRLQLTQPCWLSVSVDGKVVVYETLPAG